MLTRNEIRDYALQICLPVLERAANRSLRGDWAYKPDQVGYVPAYLENICRPFWGIAPILTQEDEIILHTDAGDVEVAAFLRSQLLMGLSHGQAQSWDRYRDHMSPYVYENQNITELAGLALGLFFAREKLWDPLTQEEKQIIARELYEMAEIAFDHSWPNNHFWFPLFTFTVLKRFGFVYERTEAMLEEGLNFLDSLYIGDGWYKDGEFGRFDYYEAWSLHLYPLLWTLVADDTFTSYQERRQAYVERTNRFLPFLTHWFAADGANVPFGRSLSYRFAASALFPVAILAGCDFNPSLAGRVMALNMDYFKKHYRSEQGALLQEGYLYHSPGTVEGYTSDGGAYWCCKAFLALLLPPEHAFWQFDSVRLPAETGDWLVHPDHPDVHLLFESSKGMVTLYNGTAQYYLKKKLTHHFGNMQAWYGKFAYHSAAGFACSTPDTVSYDSMISLYTPDETMASHRVGYTHLGWENGILHSIHTPFANDPGTTVETWLKPCGGYHIRTHKVKLSQPYCVREGGFTVPRWDDYCPVEQTADTVCVSNAQYTSGLKVLSDVPVKVGIHSSQAGYHLYAPLASYPVWESGILEPGEYMFTTVFGFWHKDEQPVWPALVNLQEE